MHYTGTIWRPPYEAASLLIEVTAGCTHHRCKFCTLYDELPFRFRMSPLEDIEADLREARRSLRRWGEATVPRVFLTGANPFVMQTARLLEISALIRRYFPGNETVGCFARVTDITPKSAEELRALRKAGYDGLTIGIETGDDISLDFMAKGYRAADILAQCRRLDEAGIRYNFFYLTGIAGAGRGEENARATAAVCNALHPCILGASMLTVYKNSALYQEIQDGNWQEAGELEKYRELRTLAAELTGPVEFAALGASNAVPLGGRLPRDRAALLSKLDDIIATMDERALRRYRTGLRHL